MSDIVEILLKVDDQASGPIEHVGASLEGLHGHLSRILDIAGGNLLADMASRGFTALASGVDDFGKGLISANASAEQMHQTLTALYGSAAESNQAFDWMTKFALSAPFTRQSIIQAGVAIASFGNDITKVLPALGNVAAVMGTDMPTAAQAFNDALAGRFQMMNRDLHISKEALVQFGMEMNKSGHITNIQSFVTAFERLVQTRFGDGMALQMQTFNGQMSNLEDQFQNFQRLAGGALFSGIKQQLFDLVNFLSSHQQQVNQFAEFLGKGFALAGQWVAWFAQVLVSNFVPAVNIVANVWGMMSKGAGLAFGIIGTGIAAFVTWFQDTAAPAIYTVIGTIAGWWATHAAQVRQAVTYIMGLVRAFADYAVTGLRAGWNIVAADAKYLWDLLQTIWRVGGDALSGNWGKLKDDLIAGMRTLGADLVDLMAAAVKGVVDVQLSMAALVAKAMVPVADALMRPFTWFAQGVRSLFVDLGGIIGAFVGMLVTAGATIGNALLTPINKAIDAIKASAGFLNNIPGMSHILGDLAHMHTLSIGGGGQAAGAADAVITNWFKQHAPGLAAGSAFALPKHADQGIDSLRSALETPFTAMVDKLAGTLTGWLDPAHPKSKAATDNAQKLGKQIVGNLFGAFGGIGGGITGGMTMQDILHAMGISTISGPNAFGPTPGQNGLPVTGFGTPPDPNGAGISGGAGASALHAAAMRVTLGNLGATFGQTLATTGGLHHGDRMAANSDRHVSSLDRITRATENTVDLTMQLLATLMRLAKAPGSGGGIPLPTQQNPLQGRGIARPRPM